MARDNSGATSGLRPLTLSRAAREALLDEVVRRAHRLEPFAEPATF
jgi:hypothetical protein